MLVFIFLFYGPVMLLSTAVGVLTGYVQKEDFGLTMAASFIIALFLGAFSSYLLWYVTCAMQ
jgi:hypothetical protein